MARKERVIMKQIDGDDGYCWCVIIDGRIKWDGMTKDEAKWRRDNERRRLYGAHERHRREVWQ